MERATRYGSCVPVTTIRIPPIWTRDQWATHPSMHPQVYFNPIPGVIGSTEDTSYDMARAEVHGSRCRGSLQSRTRPTSWSKPQVTSAPHANGKSFCGTASRFDRLTPRKCEVMTLVVAGRLNKQIVAGVRAERGDGEGPLRPRDAKRCLPGPWPS